MKRRYRGRHVLKRSKERKPLTKNDVLLRLRELYDFIDPKQGVSLTADDTEMIDYNFALVQLYDRIIGRGEVQAIGFEAEIGGEYYDEICKDKAASAPTKQGRKRDTKNAMLTTKAALRPTLWERLRGKRK